MTIFTTLLSFSFSFFFSCTRIDEIKHNCDRSTFENIFKVYNSHDTQKVKTSFTQSAYVIPLNDLSFKPWTKDGFTITSWLRLNSDQGPANRLIDQIEPPDQNDASANAENENNKNLDVNGGVCSQHCQCKHKQHFISIGTNRMMLSVYLCVTNVNTMYFQLSNPSSQSKGIVKSYSEHFRMADTTGMENGTKMPKCVCTPPNTVKKRRNNKKDPQLQYENRTNRKPRSKEKQRKNSTDDTSSASNVLSATINTTKLALKSSLSHFNLFSSNRHNDNTESHIFGYPIEIKGVKLHKNRWTLFSVTACCVDNEVQIQIFIDNMPAAQLNLPCANLFSDVKKDKLSVLCVGHKSGSITTPPSRTKDFVDHEKPPDIIAPSDLETKNFRYSLSNVLLFRKRALDKEMLAHLYALGPDCINFTQCQVNGEMSRQLLRFLCLYSTRLFQC